MSWLSSALKNNSVKIGLAIAGAYLGKEYLYGNYSPSVYDTATGKMTQAGFTGGTGIGSTLAAKTLNFLNVGPFSDTALGKSIVGDAVEFMRPGEGPGGKILGAIADRLDNRPPQVSEIDLSAYGVRGGSGASITAGQAQMIAIGRGGALQQALGRDSTQMYLASKIRGLGLPAAAPLPSPMPVSAGIRTTSMQSRAYKKLGLSKT